MKFMKWMTVTALATATVFGSFVESVEAASRGTGNKSEIGRDDNVFLTDAEFTLFSTTPAGTPRIDKDGNPDNNSGIFTDAVENFQATISSGLFALISDDVKFDSATLDLQSKLIFAGEKLLLPSNQPINLIAPNREGGEDLFTKNAVAMNDRIEYIFTGNELERQGITELALIIDESRLSFDLENPLTFHDIPSLDSLEEQKQAVNSLDYIIDNSLLNLVNRIRVSAKPSEFTIETIQQQEGVGVEIPDIVSNEEFGDASVELITVPESNPSNSLLALGVLGLALGLKRKLK